MAEQGLYEDLAARLLAWYDRHARELPWRSKPGENADPYHVWLSEIMLQQTTVAAVKSYYLKFLQLWPTVYDLAAASQDDVLRAWAGLGYYARARNLHACAKAVASHWQGAFPRTQEELRSLPGIGPYTAGAIASIAFDQPHAAVDANVERVITRLYAIEEPLPESKPQIHAATQKLVPAKRAGDFAQAIMDLGATICTPRNPNCLICPWTEECLARKQGIAETLPRKKPKAEVPTRRGVAFWVERADGAILLRRRAEKGLLGGMMEVPSTEWGDQFPQHIMPPVEAKWKKLVGLVEHTFTHFHLELMVWKTRLAEDVSFPAIQNFTWVHRSHLHAEALPTVMRKIVSHAEEMRLTPSRAKPRKQKAT